MSGRYGPDSYCDALEHNPKLNRSLAATCGRVLVSRLRAPKRPRCSLAGKPVLVALKQPVPALTHLNAAQPVPAARRHQGPLTRTFTLWSLDGLCLPFSSTRMFIFGGSPSDWEPLRCSAAGRLVPAAFEQPLPALTCSNAAQPAVAMRRHQGPVVRKRVRTSFPGGLGAGRTRWG